MTKPKAPEDKQRPGPKPKPLELPIKEVERLYQRYLDGDTYASIGQDIGKTSGQVQRMFIKAGVHSDEDNHEHWINFYARRGQTPAPDTNITKVQYLRLGPSLKGLVLERILKKERMSYRAKLIRRGETDVNKKVHEWDETHGFDWAEKQLK